MSNPKIFLQPELIEGDNIDIAQDGKTISSNTPLANITDTDITEVEDGQALIYDETSGKWINGEGGTPIEPNPAAAATDTLSTIKINNTVFTIGGGGTGDAVLYPLTTAEYNALTPEQKMDENVLYLLTDGGSSGGGGTGSGYSETVLWEDASGRSFVNSPAITLTLNDDISNYDMLMFELAPSNNPRWRYHNIALTQNIDKTGTNYFGSVTVGGTEGYAPGITYIDETSLSFHSWGQAYSLTIYKIIGIKFGGGGSNVVPNPEDAATDVLNSIKIDNATYAIPGGGSFIDVENRIVAPTEFTTSLTYTATEDCVVCMYLVCPGDASTFVKINDFTVQNFWQAELATGPCAPIFVRTGQTLTVTGAHTSYASNYTVYGVQSSSGGGGGTGNLNAVEMDYEDWLELSQEEREDPNIEYFLSNAPGGGGSGISKVDILWTASTVAGERSNITLEHEYTDYDYLVFVILHGTGTSARYMNNFIAVETLEGLRTDELPGYLTITDWDNGYINYEITSKTLLTYKEYGSAVNSNMYQVIGMKLGGGGGSSEINYSTDEQVIGTWIDGKPLYQKTIIISGTYSGRTSIDISSYIDASTKLISVEGIGKYTHQGSDNYYAIDGDVFIYPAENINTLKTNWGSTTLPLEIFLTIKYTKTTD